MVKYDDVFHNNFDVCVEEMCKEGLEWGYEPSVSIPMDLIASGVEKSRVSALLAFRYLLVWPRQSCLYN